MKWIRPRIFLMLMVLILSIGLLVGCTEAQKVQADRAAEIAQQTTEAGDVMMRNPIISALIPDNIETVVAMLGSGILAVSTWLQTKRKNEYKVATTETVRGIQVYKNGLTDKIPLKTALNDKQGDKTKEIVAVIKTTI